MNVHILAAAIVGTLATAPTAIAAPLNGPRYPMLGGLNSGHGGNVCVANAPATTLGDAAGVTWTFGGGNPTNSVECPPGPTTPQPFDTERFAVLYWGINPSSGPKIGMDNNATFTGDENLRPVGADLAGGVLAWEGATSHNGCHHSPAAPACFTFTTNQITTRVEMQVRTLDNRPVSLLSQAAAGITSTPVTLVGGVVAITPQLRNFKVTIKALARLQTEPATALRPALPFYNNEFTHEFAATQMRTSFTGAFWYKNRLPLADFNFTEAKQNVAITFEAGYRDPDGASANDAENITSIGWDFNDDGDFSDSDRGRRPVDVHHGGPESRPLPRQRQGDAGRVHGGREDD